MTAVLARGAQPEREALLAAAVRYHGPDGAALTELVPDGLAAHGSRYGPLPTAIDAAGLLDRLDALSGRGGAHFPVAAKWRAVRSAAGTPVVVGNGAEGEPLSRKDAALLEFRPHLVLDGLAVAALALGADDALLWLHEDAHAVRSAITRALAERPRDEIPIQVRLGPARYLSGESSAVVRALSGGPALPSFRLRPTAVSGVDGRPTLVQNVETLARVALTARGLDASSSVLLTVTRASEHIVAEIDSATTFRAAIGECLGPLVPEAVLLGGYGGRWVRWPELAGLPVAEARLRRHGLSLGAGVLLPVPPGTCGLAVTAGIAGYLADSGARQCGPCLFGLPALAEAMTALARGRASARDLRRLDRYCAELTGRGACHHPDGAVTMVASALSTFADDVAAHRRGGCLADAA